jgi:hypothetical protein
MNALSHLIVVSSLVSSAVFAGEIDSKAPVPMAPAPADSRWEISAGAAFGELTVDWGFASTLGFDTNALDSSASESFVGPAIDLRRVMMQRDGMTLKWGLGYSYAEASWQTGENIAGERGEGIGELYTLDVASMDLTAHRIATYADVSWAVGDTWEFGLRAGPTLTLFDGDFRGSHETFEIVKEGAFGVFDQGESLADSGTKLAFGLSAEAFVRCNVTRVVFLEVSGGYNWTDSASFGSSRIGAEVDSASYRAAVSVGVKF